MPIIWYTIVNLPNAPKGKVSLGDDKDVCDLREAIKVKMSPRLDAYAAPELLIKVKKDNETEDQAQHLMPEQTIADILQNFGNDCQMLVSLPSTNADAVKMLADLPTFKGIYIPSGILDIDMRYIISLSNNPHPHSQEIALNTVFFYTCLERGDFEQWPPDSNVLIGRNSKTDERQIVGPFKDKKEASKNLGLITPLFRPVNNKSRRVRVNEISATRGPGRMYQIEISLKYHRTVSRIYPSFDNQPRVIFDTGSEITLLNYDVIYGGGQQGTADIASAIGDMVTENMVLDTIAGSNNVSTYVPPRPWLVRIENENWVEVNELAIRSKNSVPGDNIIGLDIIDLYNFKGKKRRHNHGAKLVISSSSIH